MGDLRLGPFDAPAGLFLDFNSSCQVQDLSRLARFRQVSRHVTGKPYVWWHDLAYISPPSIAAQYTVNSSNRCVSDKGT